MYLQLLTRPKAGEMLILEAKRLKVNDERSRFYLADS